MATTARSRTGWPGGSSPPTRSVRRAARGFQCRVRHPGRPAWPAVSRFSTAAATTSLARMDAGEQGDDGARGAVLGQVIPKRRFTRWEDRKSVVEGKSVSVRVDLGGRRNMKKKTNRH